MSLQKLSTSTELLQKTVENSTERPSVSYTSTDLLQRPILEDYQAQQTAQLAAQLSQSDRSDALSALVFRLAHEWFALPASLCQQVLLPVAAHSLPHRSNATLLGVVNVRGQMLLKVSLFDLLGLANGHSPIANHGRKSKQESTDIGKIYPRMVVIGRNSPSGISDTWVFDVDELDGIHTLESNQIELPAAGIKAACACTQNLFVWQGKRVSFLNENRLFEALRCRSL